MEGHFLKRVWKMKKLIYDRDVKFGAGPIALPPAHGELNENLIV